MPNKEGIEYGVNEALTNLRSKPISTTPDLPLATRINLLKDKDPKRYQENMQRLIQAEKDGNEEARKLLGEIGEDAGRSRRGYEKLASAMTIAPMLPVAGEMAWKAMNNPWLSAGFDVATGNYGDAAVGLAADLLPWNRIRNNIAGIEMLLGTKFDRLTPSKGNKILRQRLDDLFNRDRFISENLEFGKDSDILVHGDPVHTGARVTSQGIGKGVATPDSYPYSKNGMLYPTKDKYHDYKSDSENKIFWGSGMPFFEARGKGLDNMIQFLKSKDGQIYLSTTDGRELLERANDIPTESGYRFITTEATPNINPEIRNTIGPTQNGIEVITDAVPAKQLKGFEYDPLLKTWARVLYKKNGGKTKQAD